MNIVEIYKTLESYNYKEYELSDIQNMEIDKLFLIGGNENE